MKTERISKEKHWFNVISPYDYYISLMDSNMEIVNLSALVELVLMGKSVPAYRESVKVNKVYPISKNLLTALLESPACNQDKRQIILETDIFKNSELLVLDRLLWEPVNTSTECIGLYRKSHWEPIEKLNR